jgi:hypothetical protein
MVPLNHWELGQGELTYEQEGLDLRVVSIALMRRMMPRALEI